MSFEIIIQNEHAFNVDDGRLQQAAQTVLKQQKAAPESSLTIVITTNDAVKALNQQHRAVDAPTDVLSFPADPLPAGIEDGAPYLGDLIIAHDYALAQAQRLQHDFTDSLALLVIHGTLHLLGYEHDDAAHKASMWAAQAKALHALNISQAIVPALEGDDHA